jgi:hypothetical protein
LALLNEERVEGCSLLFRGGCGVAWENVEIRDRSAGRLSETFDELVEVRAVEGGVQ